MEHAYANYISKMLPKDTKTPINIDDKMKLEFHKLEKTIEGQIELENNDDIENKHTQNINAKPHMEEDELLDDILERINKRFHGIFSKSDRVIVTTIYNKTVKGNETLKKYADNNDSKVFTKSILLEVFNEVSKECYGINGVP